MLEKPMTLNANWEENPGCPRQVRQASANGHGLAADSRERGQEAVDAGRMVNLSDSGQADPSSRDSGLALVYYQSDGWRRRLIDCRAFPGFGDVDNRPLEPHQSQREDLLEVWFSDEGLPLCQHVGWSAQAGWRL